MSDRRFWAKVAGEGECWVWTGARQSSGYGCMGRDGRRFLAHRYAYELTVGPIPAGLTLDHLCGNKVCVRPEHLEPVTLAENVRRRHRGKQYGPGDPIRPPAMPGGDALLRWLFGHYKRGREIVPAS